MSDLRVRSTGIGSWPGDDPAQATRTVRDLLGEDLPYVPELPTRGPGADMIGRAGALLAGLHIDLQPSGWRLVERSGRDERRAASYLRAEIDEAAEAYDGWSGELKVQVCGPWTLAATLRLTRGEPVLSDHGASRDLAQSLAEGVRQQLGELRRVVPQAQIALQLDEPSLPAVLAGAVRSSSGLSRIRAVDRSAVRDGLSEVVATGADSTVVHCCAPHPPFDVVATLDGVALAVDAALLDGQSWEAIAERHDAGVSTWLGVVPTDAEGTHPAPYVEPHLEMARRVGLGASFWSRTTLSPACGLAGVSPSRAIAIQRLVIDAAALVTERLSAL